MGDVLWDGPDPADRDACPYSVDFECKPAPAESLNSLESGRLLLSLNLGSGVDKVSARMVNDAKNLGNVQGPSQLKHQTSVSANFRKDSKRQDRWTCEMHIPASWLEGGTKSYEKTGSSNPKDAENYFTLEITYRLAAGNSCTARFASQDAFHWYARQKARM